MLEIFCALYIEAKPFIEHLHLTKAFYIKGHDSFINEEKTIRLTITGSGKVNACSTVARILEQCEEDTVVLSYGSCAYLNDVDDAIYVANQICDIDTGICYYPDVLLQTGIQECTFLTGSRLISSKGNPRESIILHDVFQQVSNIQQQLQTLCLYDTETSAVYETCNQFLGPHQIYCVRFPTDQDASKVTIQQIAKASESVYPKVKYLIDLLLERMETISIPIDSNMLEAFQQHIYATKTMCNELKQAYQYCQIVGIDMESMMQGYMQQEITSKQEGKKVFHELIKKCCEA